ncbi:hypothetical protein BHM03_00053338 [Ensete ventricosum]|nr:hypothetical protein BHM03_00053338 [Ensete ventricosum]
MTDHLKASNRSGHALKYWDHLISLPSYSQQKKKKKKKVITYVLVPNQAMELDDELVFCRRKVAVLEIGAEVVYAPEPAALATSKQTFKSRQIPTFATGLDVRDRLLVFLFRPISLVRMSLVTARRPAHAGYLWWFQAA